MNGYSPYYMPQMQSPYMQDQQVLQQRIDQLSQMQNQYKQPMQTQQQGTMTMECGAMEDGSGSSFLLSCFAVTDGETTTEHRTLLSLTNS